MSGKMLTGSFVALITPFNKDGSVDFGAFRTLLKFQEERGTSAVPTMSLGGHGTANMTGNIAPAELATISTPWTSYAEAENFKTAYLKLLPLLHFTYSAINPVAVKSLMKALSLPAGNLRKPLTNLDGEALAKGIRIVQELGLDKQYGYKIGPISAVAA